MVDRFKVRHDLGNRVADSLETTLKLGNDIAILNFIDEDKPELILSAKHSCPICERAVAELEPKLFSFNNP